MPSPGQLALNSAASAYVSLESHLLGPASSYSSITGVRIARRGPPTAPCCRIARQPDSDFGIIRRKPQQIAAIRAPGDRIAQLRKLPRIDPALAKGDLLR